MSTGGEKKEQPCDRRNCAYPRRLNSSYPGVGCREREERLEEKKKVALRAHCQKHRRRGKKRGKRCESYGGKVLPHREKKVCPAKNSSSHYKSLPQKKWEGSLSPPTQKLLNLHKVTQKCKRYLAEGREKRRTPGIQGFLYDAKRLSPRSKEVRKGEGGGAVARNGRLPSEKERHSCS